MVSLSGLDPPPGRLKFDQGASRHWKPANQGCPAD